MSDKTIIVKSLSSLALIVNPPKVFSVSVINTNSVKINIQAPKLINALITASKLITVKVAVPGPSGRTIALLSSSNW
jgi:hypothetical protein